MSNASTQDDGVSSLSDPSEDKVIMKCRAERHFLLAPEDKKIFLLFAIPIGLDNNDSHVLLLKDVLDRSKTLQKRHVTPSAKILDEEIICRVR